MKYATLLLGAELLLASFVTARAEPPKIPAAYHGQWCGTGEVYKRCRLEISGELGDNIFLEILPHHLVFNSGDFTCIPLAVVTKNNVLFVRLKCGGEGWDEASFVSHKLQLSRDGQVLVMRD
jgi:hypothetical protein